MCVIGNCTVIQKFIFLLKNKYIVHNTDADLQY